MQDRGVPWEPDFYKPKDTVVFEFPIGAPDTVVREDVTAIGHLEFWLKVQRHWCEHKPSVTINVEEHEWPTVGGWVWDHFDEVTGVSFLPYDGGTYKQAPYEAIDENKYNELVAKMPAVDFDELVEVDDNVEGVQTLACTGGQCEVNF
jgi:ribonucleoside-diphosphate reductase alpha chain